MKPISILRMTAYENYTGQVLWIGAAIGLVTLIMISLVSDAALSHQSRLVDVGSYFIVDLVSFITSVFMGANIYSRDFSNRGIAEVAIPGGLGRTSLILWRLSSHAVCIFVFVLFLLFCRLLSFVLSGSLPDNLLYNSLIMTLFTALKSVLGLYLAAFLGCFTRPVISLIGTVAIFAVGHFSAGINAVQGLIGENNSLGPTEVYLFKMLKIWNPNLLVLESLKGAWEVISTSELLHRLGWGLGTIIFFACLCGLSVRKRDVGALQF